MGGDPAAMYLSKSTFRKFAETDTKSGFTLDLLPRAMINEAKARIGVSEFDAVSTDKFQDFRVAYFAAIDDVMNDRSERIVTSFLKDSGNQQSIQKAVNGLSEYLDQTGIADDLNDRGVRFVDSTKSGTLVMFMEGVAQQKLKAAGTTTATKSLDQTASKMIYSDLSPALSVVDSASPEALPAVRAAVESTSYPVSFAGQITNAEPVMTEAKGSAKNEFVFSQMVLKNELMKLADAPSAPQAPKSDSAKLSRNATQYQQKAIKRYEGIADGFVTRFVSKRAKNPLKRNEIIIRAQDDLDNEVSRIISEADPQIIMNMIRRIALRSDTKITDPTTGKQVGFYSDDTQLEIPVGRIAITRPYDVGNPLVEQLTLKAMEYNTAPKRQEYNPYPLLVSIAEQANLNTAMYMDWERVGSRAIRALEHINISDQATVQSIGALSEVFRVKRFEGGAIDLNMHFADTDTFDALRIVSNRTAELSDSKSWRLHTAALWARSMVGDPELAFDMDNDSFIRYVNSPSPAFPLAAIELAERVYEDIMPMSQAMSRSSASRAYGSRCGEEVVEAVEKALDITQEYEFDKRVKFDHIISEGIGDMITSATNTESLKTDLRLISEKGMGRTLLWQPEVRNHLLETARMVDSGEIKGKQPVIVFASPISDNNGALTQTNRDIKRFIDQGYRVAYQETSDMRGVVEFTNRVAAVAPVNTLIISAHGSATSLEFDDEFNMETDISELKTMASGLNGRLDQVVLDACNGGACAIEGKPVIADHVKDVFADVEYVVVKAPQLPITRTGLAKGVPYSPI